MIGKPDIEELERLAHELYEAWRESRADEDWQAYLEVKERLDNAKGY